MELLRNFGSLRGLLEATEEELAAVSGIGPAAAVRIKAVLELAKRYATQPPDEPITIRTPADVAQLLGPEMRHLNQEHFRVLLLNSKNQVLQAVTVSIGTLNATLVHPREVFRLAIKRNCAAVILAHSHPPGVPTPSQEDISLTRRLVEAGKLLGIEVLDHVVIGDGHMHWCYIGATTATRSQNEAAGRRRWEEGTLDTRTRPEMVLHCHARPWSSQGLKGQGAKASALAAERVLHPPPPYPASPPLP